MVYRFHLESMRQETKSHWLGMALMAIEFTKP